MAKRKLSTTTTQAPSEPDIKYTTSPGRLSENDWGNLSNDLYQSINASLSVRAPLEQNLKDWTDLYEMRVDGTDWPWVNASNVFIPVIPAQLDTAVAYITQKVFVPRFYIVTGNTPQAQDDAHTVEQYYNAELTRQRGQTTWYDQYINWLHLSFRDGTSVMEVIWRKTVSKRKVVTFEPMQSDDGTPVIDMTTGQVKRERKITDIVQVDYNDVEMKPVLLRDFLLIPSEADSIENAVGVARALWLYESDCMALVRDGVFNAEEVEFALAYVPTGTNEYSTDRQGPYDRTAGDQLSIGLGQGSQTSRFFANRGPIKVWRIHSRAYDMNGDGIPEENIFWLDELTQRMLGWQEYEYIVPGRPFFSFSPYPRPERFYGYSLCERLAPIQAEVNSMYNARNNLIDLMLSPPLLYATGEELDDNEQQWGPGVRWQVSDPNKAVKFMEFPQVPLASFQNESLLNSYVDKLLGVSAPAMGAQSSGRRTATEMKQQMASTSTRNDAIALRLRIICRSIFSFIHKLKLQYLDSDPEMADSAGNKFTIPKETLAQDFRLEIAGSSDPLDASARRMEALQLFQILMGVPFISQDQVKVFSAVRMLLETFNRPDVTSLIGTDKDAQGRQQQMMQAAQQQQKMTEIGQKLQIMKGEPPTMPNAPHQTHHAQHKPPGM